MADVKKTRDWLLDKRAKPDYMERVPQKVRDEDSEKISNLNIELETITNSLNSLKKWNK